MALALLTATLGPSLARAQTLYGSVVGNVGDPLGAAVTGATVRATNPETNLNLETVTDGRGAYVLSNLLPGVYDLTVSKTGFRTIRRTGVRLSAGDAQRNDLRLDLGLATEVVVTGEATLLKTERADLSADLSSKEIVNLPLNQFRNYQRLLDLVPGTTPAQLQNAEIDTPGRALSTSVNGTQRNSNAYRIDGAVSVNLWLPHHVGYVQPAETIETVHVATNNFAADQGMAAGAAVTVVTKSGTNDFHGSGFLFRSQDELNANTVSNNAFGLPRSPLSNSIYGATLGGPILKNRVFFFAGWERYAGRRGFQQLLSVPSLKMRDGDFSEVAKAYPAFRLYDPSTGAAGGVGRKQFPGFVIPSNRISPVWRGLLDYYPRPNTDVDLNRNGLPDDYARPRETRNDRDNVDAKITWQRSPSHTLWAKFGVLDAKVIDEFTVGFDEGSVGDTRIYVGTFGHTWTLGPHLVLDGNVGLNQMRQQVVGPDQGEDLGRALGLPGTNGATIRESGLPQFDVPNGGLSSGQNDRGVYDVGTTPSWIPLNRREASYTLSTAVTWIRGGHQLRAGVDVVHHRLDHRQAEGNGVGGIRGGFVFAGFPTATPGYIPLVWNELAGLVLGRATARLTGVQGEDMTAREWQFATFMGDTWHATRSLTLNLGLRLEAYPLMSRANRGLERLDYQTYEVLFGGLGGVPEDVGIHTKTVYIAPRLGATYRVGADTVVRAGYGRTFNPIAWARPMRGTFPYDLAYNQTAEQYASFPLEEGIPASSVPDLTSGHVKLPAGVFFRSPNPTDVDRATIQQMNVAVERRVPGDIALEVAYVHTRTDGGYADINLNYSEPGAGQAGRQFFRVAGTTNINDWAARTRSRYHALQVAANRPFKNGLLLKGAYTLSRAENETDEDGAAALGWSYPAMQERNFALAGYDRTHVLQMGFVYELPFLRNSHGTLARLSHGWQVNGIASAYSGTPFSITAVNPQLNCPGCGPVVIDVQGDPRPTGTPGSAVEPWYAKSLFSQPAGASLAGFGNSRRNQFRTPGLWNVDLGLFRSFRIGGVRPEFRIEAANVFNHTNWGRPNLNVNSPLFMTFQPTAAHEFNTIWGTATHERTVQVGLRLEF